MFHGQTEADLLRGWKSVYDYEEEASGLYCREQVAVSIIETHQHLSVLRELLEQVQGVVPRAHDTLSAIAAAGLALSHRYPLANMHPHMISTQIHDELATMNINNNNSSSSSSSSSRSSVRDQGSPSRSGVGSESGSRPGAASSSSSGPGGNGLGSRSSSPCRGVGSSSSSSSSNLTDSQLQELDETVAMRLHRLTQVR